MRTWKSCAEEGIALYKCCKFLKAEELFVESVRRARNDNAAPEQLAEALNNLAAGYSARAKYQDATTALREAFSLTKDESTPGERLQKALAMHIRSQLYLEQEHFDDAKTESVLALKVLGAEHTRVSCEFWYNIARAELGLGNQQKALESVDQFLQTASMPMVTYIDETDCTYPIYLEPAIAFTFFGPGWEIKGVSDEWHQTENMVRAQLLKSSMTKLLYGVTRKHQEEALVLCEKLGPHQLTAETYFLVSRRLAFSDHDWETARNYCGDALSMIEQQYGNEHPLLPSYLLNRACLTSVGESIADYKPLLDRAFEIIDKSFGTRHPKRARLQLMYGSLMPVIEPGDKDILQHQEDVALEALNGVLDFFDDTHSLVIAAKLQVANIMIRDGRLRDAEELLKQILEDAVSICGSQPHHLVSCISEMLNLADLLEPVERYAIWELVVNSAEKLDFNQYKDDIGRQIDIIRSTAYIFNRTNMPSEAELLLLMAYELAKEVDADLALDCKVDLICLYQRMQKFEEALILLDQEDRGATPRHQLTQNVRLADILVALERTAEAEQLALGGFSQAEQILHEFVEPFLNYFRILFNLYLEQNRLDEATRVLGIVQSKKEYFSTTAQDVLPVFIRKLAEGYASQHDQRAEKYYVQALESAELIRGRAPHVLDSCYISYAEYLLQCGQVEKAYELQCCSLELRQETFGPDDYWTAIAMLSVSELSVIFDIDRALDLSKKALAIMEKHQDQDEEILLSAYQIRAEILERTPQRLDAIKYHDLARKLEVKLAEKRKETPV